MPASVIEFTVHPLAVAAAGCCWRAAAGGSGRGRGCFAAEDLGHGFDIGGSAAR